MIVKRVVSFLLALCLCVTASLALAEAEIPELEFSPREIPDNEAMAFLRRMGVGWNLGNTFDAYSGERLQPVRADHLATEKSWTGNYTRREVIQALAEAGFGFIRIPISWHNHVTADFTINGAWLDRVQEVVDWSLDAGLIVIINIHHDNFPDFFYPDSEHLEGSLRYVSRIWEQVAARFADYDERLVFEALNEPRLVGTGFEWNFQAGNPVCQDAAACLTALEQTFVDTVRAAGGKNADRYLVVPSYGAAPANTNPKFFTLPADTAENRIIVAAHAYVPYSFALEANGTPLFNHNVIMDAGSISGAFRPLYDNYISKGIPVVMDEFGSMNRDENTAARVDHAAYFVACGASYGIPVCWWDNGNFKGNGERFGIIRRSNGQWVYPEIVEAMMQYRLK